MATKKKSSKKKASKKNRRPRIMSPSDLAVPLPPNVRSTRYNHGFAMWAVDGAGNAIALGYWPD
jgi:hypothetical protein